MCNHNNGRSTNLTYMRRRGFFSPKKRSRHPFSSTFDLSLQLFFKISTQLERKFLQIANHEEQSCSILVPYLYLSSPLCPLINKFPIPIIGRKFRICYSHPVLPCVLRRRAREREKLGEREREERKKKERRRNGS